VVCPFQAFPALVTMIFGQAQTIQSILNQIDTNSDQIPIFLPGKLFVFLPEIFVQRLDKY
jgi:hypothetical protein